MRRKFIIAGISLATLAVGTVGSAADQYTYRAGQAYLKVAASDHTQCETQCRGDAACRGWNFVRPNPRSRSGICEFNARKAVPVSSPVSISGEINTGVDALMSHAVPFTGMGGSTVRVGTPIVPKREIPKRRIVAPKMATAPAQNTQRGQQKRIVKRMPVPTAGQIPTSADYRRTIPAAKPYVRTPRVYGGVAPKAQPQQSQPQPNQTQTRQMQKRQMTQQQIYRDQMLAAQRRAPQQRMPQQRMPQQPFQQPVQQRTLQQFAQQPYPQAPVMPQQASQMQAPQVPQQMQQQARPQTPPQTHPQTPPSPQMMPGAPSLYGSLHDDLTQNMTPVPRPQTAPDQAANPDAPLSTSRAVPTEPVQAEPLGYPAIPGLAGG